MRTARLGAALGAAGLVACGGGAETGAPPDAPTGGVIDAPGESGDAADDTPVPTEPAALQAWLAARGYASWQAESAPHPSAGPHGGDVRTFVNASLAASLSAGTDHEAGAAAVKELYGQGDAVTGWAVSVKLQADSDGGDGWYWYEAFSTAPDAEPDYEGVGLGLCTGCHASGDDYVLIPFPLD